MNTDDEIHDTIQTTEIEAMASTLSRLPLSRILEILDALNDQIESLERQSVKDFAATHDRITSAFDSLQALDESKAPRCLNDRITLRDIKQ